MGRAFSGGPVARGPAPVSAALPGRAALAGRTQEHDVAGRVRHTEDHEQLYHFVATRPWDPAPLETLLT